MRVGNKMFGTVVLPIAVATWHNKRISEAYMSGQSFIELSSTCRVRPVPLLNSDRLSSLPGNVEVRNATSTNAVGSDANENQWMFTDSLEQRLKRMEDKQKQLEDENAILKRQREEDSKQHDEDRNRLNRFDTENRQLKQRLVALEKSKPKPDDSGVIVAERSTSCQEKVKVNGIKHGAVVLVLYVMARECIDANAAGGVSRRSATRKHREEHSAQLCWEFWARIAFFSFLLQMAMLAILHNGMSQLVRSNDAAEYLPVWQSSIAGAVFAYNTFRTGTSSILSAMYCYLQMETLQLFQKHENPKRTRLFAVLLFGWELIIFNSIAISGSALVGLPQTSLDLILNVVALQFLYELDDYIINFAPGLGILGDIDVPKCVVLPTYITEPQWRDSRIFYWIARIFRFMALDTPIFAVYHGLLAIFIRTKSKAFFTDNPSDFDIFNVQGWHFVLLDCWILSWMSSVSLRVIWKHLEKSPSRSILDRFVMYAKAACFLLIYYVVNIPGSIAINIWATQYFELSLWLPMFIGPLITWSCFTAILILFFQ